MGGDRGPGSWDDNRKERQTESGQEQPPEGQNRKNRVAAPRCVTLQSRLLCFTVCWTAIQQPIEPDQWSCAPARHPAQAVCLRGYSHSGVLQEVGQPHCQCREHQDAGSVAPLNVHARAGGHIRARRNQLDITGARPRTSKLQRPPRAIKTVDLSEACVVYVCSLSGAWWGHWHGPCPIWIEKHLHWVWDLQQIRGRHTCCNPDKLLRIRNASMITCR